LAVVASTLLVRVRARLARQQPRVLIDRPILRGADSS
jgi:hypothetical protein